MAGLFDDLSGDAPAGNLFDDIAADAPTGPKLPPMKKVGRGFSVRPPPAPEYASVLQRPEFATAFEQAPDPVANATALFKALTRTAPANNPSAFDPAPVGNPDLVKSPMYGAGAAALTPGPTVVQDTVRKNAEAQRNQRERKRRVQRVQGGVEGIVGENPLVQAAMAAPNRMAAGAAQVVGGVASIPQLFGSDLGSDVSDWANLVGTAAMGEDPGIADQALAAVGQMGPMVKTALALRAGAAPLIGAEAAAAAAPRLTAGVGAGMTGGEVLRELQDRTDLTAEEKQGRALFAALVSGVTGAKADKFLFPGSSADGAGTAIAKAFLSQGAQEGFGDQVVQNFATDKPLGQGVPQAFAVGGLAGGLVRGVGEVTSDEAALASAINADANAFANTPPPRSVWAPTQPVAAPAAPAAPAGGLFSDLVAETPPVSSPSTGTGQPVPAADTPPAGMPVEPNAYRSAGTPTPEGAPDGTAPSPAAGQPVQAVAPTGARPDIPATDGALADAAIPEQPRAPAELPPAGPVAADAAGRGQDAGQGALAPATPGSTPVAPPPAAAPAPAAPETVAPAAGIGGQPAASTAQSIRQELHARYGQRTIDALEKAGVLKIWDRADEFNATQGQGSRAFADGDTQGMYFKGTAHLFGSGIQPGLAVPVMLHESGEHAGMKKMLGDKRYGDLVRRAFQLADSDPIARQALARIPDQTNPKFFDSEMVAYLIEEAAAARASASPALRQWLADLVAAIRAWAYTTPLAQKLSKAGIDLKLTPQDVVALAERSVRAQAKEAGRTIAAKGDTKPKTPTPAAVAPAPAAAPAADQNPIKKPAAPAPAPVDIQLSQREPAEAPPAEPQATRAPETADEPQRSQPDRRSTDRTVQVDGVRRPDSNSQGKPLTPPSQGMQATVAFWRWFGDSRVVDEQGRPMVVYHGTAAGEPINKFGGMVYAGWFTPSTDKANVYTRMDEDEQDGAVYPAYLSIKNPLDLSMLDGNDEFDAAALAAAMGEPEQEVQDLFDNVASSSQLWSLIDSLEFREWVEALGKDGVKIKEGGAMTWAALRPEQIKSATGNSGSFDGGDADIRYSRRVVKQVGDQTQSPEFKRWSNDAPVVRAGEAEEYPFKSGQKVVVEGFHGTKRPDRVGTVFKRSRATSGPMSFFTASPMLASSYAQGKADTSLANEDQQYATWFQFKPKGERSGVDIDRAWYRLDPETKSRIAALAPRVMTDDTGENIILGDESVKTGNGGYYVEGTRTPYDRQGNPLKALVDAWLDSASLFNEEERFLEVLKLAGFPVQDVTFNSPFAEYPFVYQVWVAMQKPLVVSDIPQEVRDALDQAAKRDRSRAAPGGADMWDKNTRTLKEWVRNFADPENDSNAYVWTSIPDKVTDVFKSLGYDGIIDWSGKGGGHQHPVYIPFRESQVKSVTGNRGTFDADSNDIRYSRAPSRTGGTNHPNAVTTGAQSWTVQEPSSWDSVVRTMQDNKIDLKRVRDAVEEHLGRQLADGEDAYMGEGLYHGKVAERIKRLHRERVEPILAKIAVAQKNNGVTLDDVNEYLHARHAPEANAQMAAINPGPGNTALSGMSNAEAAAAIARLRTAGKEAALQAIAKDVWSLLADVRTDFVADGLEEAPTVWMWEQAYKHYVPLYRDMGADVQSGTPRGTGFAVKGPEAKRRTGSDRAVVDILANVVGQAETAAIRAEKAEVGRQLLEMVENNPNPDFWTVDTPKTKRVIDPATGLVTTQTVGLNGNEPNVVPVKNYGVTRYVVFNERNERAMMVARAMKNLDVAQVHPILQWAGKGTRFMASLLTQRNPEFWLTNLARDLQGTAIQLGSTDAAGVQAQVAKNLPAALAGMRDLVRNDGTGLWARRAQELKDLGGTTGYMESFATSTDRMAALEKEVAKMQQGKADPRRVFRSVIDFIDDYNDIIENGVRLAVFQAARDAGISDTRAAWISKNITVNFNKKGNLSAPINTLYMFANASVQGTARMMEAVVKSRQAQAIVGGIAMAGFVMDIVNRTMAGDDDETGKNRYDMISQHEKATNWIFMRGEGKYLKVPMPLGYNIFHNAGRLFSDAFNRKDPRDASEYGWSMATMVAGTFLPIGGPSIAQVLAPSLLDPAIQVAENKNFMGGPVYRSDDAGFGKKDPRPAYTRYFDTTPDTWKQAAKAMNDLTGGDSVKPGLINVEPDILRHVYGALTGGPGRALDKSLDTSQASARGEKLPPSRYPLAGRFAGEVGDREKNSAFFEEQKRVASATTQYDYFLKERRRDLADEIAKDVGDGDVARGRRLMAEFKRTDKDVRQINAAIRKLRQDKVDDKVQAAEFQRLKDQRTRIRSAGLRRAGAGTDSVE